MNPEPFKPSQISRGYDFPAYLLTKVFPFHLAFNREMRVVQMGDGFQQLYPDLKIGNYVQEYFQVHHPELPLEFEAIQQKSALLFLLESVSDNLQFEGQVVVAESQEIIFFLGAPWINDSKSLKSLGLKLKEYSVQDSISDFLFLLQARSGTLADMRQLAEQLTKRRIELDRAMRQAELATTVLEQAADAIEIMDADLKILYVNSGYEQISGYRRDEIVGKSSTFFLRADESQNNLSTEIWQKVTTGEVWQGSLIDRRKDGSFYYQDATIFPVTDLVGKITNYVTIKRDISDRKRTQTKLEHSVSLLRATFEATADGILVADIRGKIINFNQKFVDLWQMPAAILDARDSQQVMRFIETQLKNPEGFSAKKTFELYVRPHNEGFETLELKDGRSFERYSCPQRLDETIIGWVWSFRDITERRRTEEKIRYQALHDALTGLPNRSLFGDRLSVALSQAARGKSQLAVMFLDLDRFKVINDTLGHAAGDLLLQGVAKRLNTCLREGDTVARWAGDEFTLLLPNIQSRQDVDTIAQRILEALRTEFELEGQKLYVSISIGIAFYPTDGKDAETLLKNADAALYRAKEGGRSSYQVYTSAINSGASELLALEHHLHQALTQEEFVLYYQPQVNVVTGEITQMEALLRWQHPEKGLILPGKFIPLAEDNGLIVPIGEWALRAACEQNRRWQKAGLTPVRIAVNLSPSQFRQPKLLEMIHQILLDTQLDPHCLELEITETAMMKNAELTQMTLSRLCQMGVSIALDDFGTGYSSLGYLKKFPFQTLKIDQSFVQDLPVDPNDEAIVAAIVALGKVLNLKLVAEGVETSQQKRRLQSLDCYDMQGYLFSRPVTSEVATELLRSDKACKQINAIKGRSLIDRQIFEL